MTEQERIVGEYQSRERKGVTSIYNPLLAASLIAGHSLERAIHRCLRRARIPSLKEVTFLDVGCGAGGQLLRWIQWGATPARCSGVDLIADRIAQAKARLPAGVELAVGDASRLPFPDGAFQITSQLTVLSSILDDGLQEGVAREMLRVTATDGLILSYDFWTNPRNPATRGVGIGRLRRLFPDCGLYVQRITLAPPICRRVAPFSSVGCRLLEAVGAFNTHYLAMIQRRRRAQS